MGQGPQKADHGGNFFMTPRRVTASVAWRHLSFRARAVLQAFEHAFNGHNNGEIAFAIHDIGKAIGSASHGLTAKAVAELIEKGFLEQTSDENRAMSKARTYRITFVATGKARAIEPATHDYEDWRPMQKRKFGSGETPSKNPSGGGEMQPTVQDCLGDMQPTMTESRGFEGLSLGGDSPRPLYNHSSHVSDGLQVSPEPLKLSAESSRADLGVEPVTLRQWVAEVLKRLGYGGARQLAEAAKVPEPALSRFRSGKNLPDHYRIPLQIECSKVIRFDELEVV
ncbi:hypothetical protein [Croceicoccus marinus]|uniref:Uncharacterized protein n=1 Tax=Croceicoccus marinus TaxID=450378 RepID=A0A7G6VRV0_9SPHN|nr:hypothetical protein [Croceicoccus marinus]QNE04465.1 hypothetical protein H4O24_10830 [Croceicoccus marinus]